MESLSLHEDGASSFSMLNESQARSEFSIVSGSKLHATLKSVASFAELIPRGNQAAATSQEPGSTGDLSASIRAMSSDDKALIARGVLDVSRYSVI